MRGSQFLQSVFLFNTLTKVVKYQNFFYFRMQHIEKCLDKYEKLRHRQFWWQHTSEASTPRRKGMNKEKQGIDRVTSKEMLLICPDGDVLRQRKHDSSLWRDLLFTDPLWVPGGPFYSHTDHTLSYTPETIEHRAMRMRHLREKEGLVS